MDLGRLAEIKRIMAENSSQEECSNEQEAKIIALSYNLSLKIDRNPELYKIELASAGAVRLVLPTVAKYAFEVAKKYMTGQASKQFIDIITKEEDLGQKILEKSKKKQENKTQEKPAATSLDFGQHNLDPDSDDEQNCQKKRHKYTNYDKSNDIGIERFTKREKGGGLTDPKSGQYLSPDHSNQPHGGSYWKLKSKKGDRGRIGTNRDN